MIIGAATSKNGVKIRLTEERWFHLWFVVVYKEVNKDDGFIITSYLTTDMKWLLKREMIWNKES